jgi:zinc protease
MGVDMSDILKMAAALLVLVLGTRVVTGAESATGGAPATASAPATSGAPAKGTAPIVPYPIDETVLPNGLKVIAVPMDSPGLIAYWTVVRAGSRNEVEPGLSGFAHFFEHMMFRGTDKYPRDKYNDVLKAFGADHNAFTQDDMTAYHVLAPSSALETLMTIESDRFMNLKYPADDFKKEAGAVLGEYNKNAANPYRKIQEAMRNAAFTKHTYKHTTLGFLKDILDMPNQYDYSLKFFDRFYRPENCVVLVVGDVKKERLFDLAKKYYGGWKRGAWQATIPVEPEQKEEQRVDLEWPVASEPYLSAGYHVPAFSATGADLPALDLLSQLLFSESAPLYQKLVVEDQVVDVLTGGAEDHRDPYLFTWATRLKKEADLPRVEKEITAALDALKTDLVPAGRLKDVQSHMKYQFAMGLDTAAGTAEALAHFVSLTGDPNAVNQLYATYERITPEQIRDVARRTFNVPGRTLVSLRYKEPPKEPAKEPAAAPAAPSAPGGSGGAR